MADAAEEVGQADLPLPSPWVWFEHLHLEAAGTAAPSSWDMKTRMLGRTDTVSRFWSYFDSVPSPSVIFLPGVCVGRTLESLSIFRSGVQPKWEDPANEQGGEWYGRRSFPPGIIDALWELLVVAVVSENLDQSRYVTGVRICDKTNRHRAHQRIHRIEVWFSAGADAEALRTSLIHFLTGTPVDVMDNGTRVHRALTRQEIPRFEARSHEVQKAVELQKELGLVPTTAPPPSAWTAQSRVSDTVPGAEHPGGE